MTVDDENSLSRKAILVWGEVMSLIHGRADNPEWSLQAPALIYDALLAEREAALEDAAKEVERLGAQNSGRYAHAIRALISQKGEKPG
jgi:hypothetical protein